MQKLGKLERGRTVSEFMTPNPICAKPTSTVSEVAELLLDAGVRHLPIVDEGRLVGIVSDRDVRTIAGSYLNMPAELTARPYPCVTDFCNADVITVSPADDIVEVIDLMLDHKIGAVPVVDSRDQKLVGIVTYVDVLREVRAVID